MKSNKWCLIRQRVGGVFYLNDGDTTIGRNKTADVITVSNICSRNHCSINLDSNEQITITNQSTNGTYVNEHKIESPYVLKHGDYIGLGCNQTILDLVPTEELNTYFVFRLVDQSLPEQVIDLISDEEEEKEEEVKPIIENLGVDKGSNYVVSDDEPAPVSSADDHAISVENQELEFHDDNENYSQRMLMEIKEEVNCPDEDGDHEADFSIVIYSSDESEDESWKHKLSQNQDFVIKKVTESIQSKKRKETKQIEAIPLHPVKKARRNSVAATISHVNERATNKQTINGQRASMISGEPSTSKSSNENQNQTKHPNRFIDPLDPFAAKGKKVDKQNTTFEAALKGTNIIPKKKRIAHTPKSATQSKVTPILRLRNGAWPSERDRNKNRLKVSFADSPIEHTYVQVEYPKDEILIPSPAKAPAQLNQSDSFENDPLHNIITDITEWKTSWIANRNETPPLNGVNLIICPITDGYSSFESYKQVWIPLLKHELWSSIQAENRVRNRFEVSIITMSLFKRADRKRYVFHVSTESGTSRAQVGDLVFVEAANKLNFFAYITSHRFTRSGYAKTLFLTMEASENMVKLQNGEPTVLYITPLANIRTELKLFNAILYLDRTPMKDFILNPKSYRESKIPNQIQKFEYSGYDKLNKEQMEILKSIYSKCLHSSINLSLIEGPPGTGKTRLIVSIILQLLFGQEMKKKLRVLVLTSSNAAVDIVARKLLHIREKLENNDKRKFLNLVRFGVLSSMHADVQKIAPHNLRNNNDSLSSPIKQCDQMKTLLDAQKSLENDIQKLSKNRNAKTTSVQDQIKDTEKRLNQIKATIEMKTKASTNANNDFDGIKEVMAGARVVLSTLSSAINLKKFLPKFDVCFIDEASQCTEPWSLVPLQYNITSFILVGDSNQLSPVVLSPVCREKGVERSLFARLHSSMSENIQGANTYTMNVQYRMHPDICAFPNEYFYQNRLKSAPQTAYDFPLQPYNLFSLSYSQSNCDMVNFYNVDEANFIISMLKVMVKHANPKTSTFGIITPYAKQREEIKNLLLKSRTLASFDIPVNTIDSYQGQEKDIIILCTTRTTGIGFLANPQRLNVALTRAKKCLVICGNFKSISHIGVWRELLNNAQRRGKIHDIPQKYDFPLIAELLVKRKLRSAES